MKQNGVTDDALRLYLFPYSLTHHATAWFDRLSKNSIHTFEEMISKYSPPSMVTKLRNDISNFSQLPEESLFEAWERYKLSIDRCPNHKMLPVTQIDTFYNGLILRHRDTINAAARAQRGESSRSTTSSSLKIAALAQQMTELTKNVLRISQSNQQVNVVNPSCETCGGPHQYFKCQAAGGFTQGDVYATTGTYNAGGNSYQPQGNHGKAFNERPQGALPSNTIPNPREDIKLITTRSGMALARPSVPPHNPSSSSKEVERDPETNMDQVHIPSSESTARVPSPIVQPAPVSKPNEIPERNPHQPHIPYPSSFAEALAQMPKYAKMLKDLLTNKEKLLELVNTPLNENCSVVLLRKLPEKLGDPGKFLIPYDFSELEECMALADLELANRSVAYLAGIAEDVFMQVGKFTFPADFVVVDYDVDPRVPLILGRPFLRTARALVDVHGEELTLRVGDEKLIFNVESISKYPRKHGDESINKIDILDTTCEDYFHEVLNVQQSIHPLSGSPTPSSEPVVASLSPSLTPFGDSDFLLEETDAFLSLDDSIPPGIENGIYDSEGDILFLEELLNDDPTNDLPPPKELKNDEIKTTKSSIEDPPELELKDLPPHLEYAFLEGTSKLPVIIAKDLKREEKDQLVKVLKSHKRAIAWKISDIRGIDPNFCTHKILMKDDFKPSIQHQRRIVLGLVLCMSYKKGGMIVVTNDNNKLISTRLVTGWRVCIDYRKLNDATRKDHFPLSFMDQMLKRLAGNDFYYFLNGFSSYFQIRIDSQDQEKTTFTCPYGTFSYRRMHFGLCNAPRTFQRCMVVIFHDMIEKSMEVFMDDFSVFGDSFSYCLSNLGKMLKRCEDTNLVLNWEKCHFMVKEGIVLGHKISKSGIEVDRAKVNVIAKLPLPTTVKGIRSFLGHAGFYRRFIQDFSKIAQHMTYLLEKETSFVFSKECMESLEILKTKLTEAPILVAPDWDLPFEIMCDASDFAMGAVLDQ
ncbi:reverse transcriptase domain-containing protein [Tanacetum coccineum]